MSRSIRRWLLLAIAAIATVVAIIEGAAYIAAHPQDVPWTRLDLDQPIGRFTGPKLAALGEDPRRCRALLADNGVADRPAATIAAAPPCGYSDGMRLVRQAPYRPTGLVTACPVAAALAVWERDILQPAAMRHFGQRATAIEHAGSYTCRRIAGRGDGAYSEHSTADAIDIMGVRLADGRSISVLRDWNGDPARDAFLREVCDGGCRLFSTALSPDYNRAHADHLHFDLASRGAWGGRLCN